MWYWYLLILVLVILVLWWALTRNSKTTETSELHHEVDAQESRAVEMEVVEEASAAPPAPPAVEGKPDDLVILEGIGPKIAGLLRQAGISTFQQLADVDLAMLRELLDTNKLQFVDPTSWPEQARLAAAGDEEGLRALQDQLKGGRIA